MASSKDRKYSPKNKTSLSNTWQQKFRSCPYGPKIIESRETGRDIHSISNFPNAETLKKTRQDLIYKKIRNNLKFKASALNIWEPRNRQQNQRFQLIYGNKAARLQNLKEHKKPFCLNLNKAFCCNQIARLNQQYKEGITQAVGKR